jgi:cytochrome c biogenesis protein CcdA
MDLDTRTTALVLARGRAIVGLVLVFVPGLAAWLWFGDTSPRTRALLRMIGVRDLILGVGALTTVKERTQDAEWVGMGAVADAVDGVVTITMGGVPLRGRLVGPTALASAFLGLKLSRELADARTATPPPA